MPVDVDGICGVGDGVGQGGSPHQGTVIWGALWGRLGLCPAWAGDQGNKWGCGREEKKALFGIGFPSAGNVKF